MDQETLPTEEDRQDAYRARVERQEYFRLSAQVKKDLEGAARKVISEQSPENLKRSINALRYAIQKLDEIRDPKFVADISEVKELREE